MCVVLKKFGDCESTRAMAVRVSRREEKERDRVSACVYVCVAEVLLKMKEM